MVGSVYRGLCSNFSTTDRTLRHCFIQSDAESTVWTIQIANRKTFTNKKDEKSATLRDRNQIKMGNEQWCKQQCDHYTRDQTESTAHEKHCLNEGRDLLKFKLERRSAAEWSSGQQAGFTFNSSRVRTPVATLLGVTLGKLFTHLPLSPSSTTGTGQ